MLIRFTKMQGAGNDFVVLDETQGRLNLTPAHYRLLADRHFGVGADQILSVRPAPTPELDFEYVIHNADGGEVQQCGNGARCFARYVRERGLTHKDRIRVQTRAGVITLQLTPDGGVTVDMGCPVFEPARVPFDTHGLQPVPQGSGQKWPLTPDGQAQDAPVFVSVVSMGNPHAVLLVEDVDTAPVAQPGACRALGVESENAPQRDPFLPDSQPHSGAMGQEAGKKWAAAAYSQPTIPKSDRLLGPWIESHPRFPERVNVGFLQVVARGHVRLRVYERGAGETLACGTGACAAVAVGVRLGLLDHAVQVDMRGGRLHIAWGGRDADPVFMTGPASTVFEGQMQLPDTP